VADPSRCHARKQWLTDKIFWDVCSFSQLLFNSSRTAGGADNLILVFVRCDRYLTTISGRVRERPIIVSNGTEVCVEYNLNRCDSSKSLEMSRPWHSENCLTISTVIVVGLWRTRQYHRNIRRARNVGRIPSHHFRSIIFMLLPFQVSILRVLNGPQTPRFTRTTPLSLLQVMDSPEINTETTYPTESSFVNERGSFVQDPGRHSVDI